MIQLQRVLIMIGVVAGGLLVIGMDIWPSRWLAALIVLFLSVVGGLWAVTYATRGGAQ